MNIKSPSVLRNLDLIASDIKFKLFGKEKYKTLFGSLLTLVILILITIYGGILLFDMINKSSPTLNMSKLYSKIPIKNDFSNTFPLMMSVVKRGTIYLNNPDSYFTISAYSINNNITLNSDGQKVPGSVIHKMTMTKCNQSEIQNILGVNSNLFIEAAKNPNLDQLYCFPIGQNLSYLSGVYGSAPFNYIDFSINFCNNSTSNVTCQPIETIQKTLSNVFALAIFPDYYIDPYNPDSPNNYYLRTQAFPISSMFYKRYYFVYKQVLFKTDNGLVYEDLSSKSFFQYDYLDKDMNINISGLTPDSFAEFSFVQYSNIYDFYFRSYKKAATIIAELGGALNAFLIIAKILNYYFEMNTMKIKIFESFCLESIQSKPKIIPFEKVEINKSKDLSKLNIIGDESKKNSNFELKSNLEMRSIHSKDLNSKNDIKEIVSQFPRLILLNNIGFSLIGDSNNYKRGEIKFTDFVFCWRNDEVKKLKIQLMKDVADLIIDLEFIFENLTILNKKN